jgi:hypothetical protein
MEMSLILAMGRCCSAECSVGPIDRIDRVRAGQGNPRARGGKTPVAFGALADPEIAQAVRSNLRDFGSPFRGMIKPLFDEVDPIATLWCLYYVLFPPTVRNLTSDLRYQQPLMHR